MVKYYVRKPTPMSALFFLFVIDVFDVLVFFSTAL